MKRTLLAVALTLSALTRLEAAPQPRTYPCYRLAQQPVIDGKLHDEVWATLPEATGFYALGRDGFAVRKPTSFRVGWSADALYLAVRCREPFTSWLNPLTGDDDSLWDDDSIEIFLAPAGTDFVQLIANTAGARWNGRNGEAAPTMWDWQVKAAVSGDEWTMEARVPFAVLGRTPKEGDSWRFNIARNVTTGPAGERYSSWSPVKGGFSEVAAFATLAFKGAPVAADVAAAQEQLSADFRTFIGRKPAGPANAVSNGSFEDGLRGWGPQPTAGKINLDETTATEGVRSIRLDSSARAELFVAAMQGLKLKAGTDYLLRCDIKRTRFSSGNISVDVLERDTKDGPWTHHRCGDSPERIDRPDAWGHYELRFRTSDKLQDAAVILYNINSAAVAWYDNIELVEDNGVETAGAPGFSTVIRLQLQVRDASAKLLVNGETVTLEPGRPLSKRIQEGLNVICIDAQAQGPNPGVKVRIAGDPLTDTRWRVSTQENPAWTGSSFDDNGWPMAAADAQNFLWASDKTERVFLRQVVLWNQGHDGPDRCIMPAIKEWGISEGTVENLSLMLYSHFPFALNDYEFVLDVPTEFRLLDILQKGGRGRCNVQPAGVATERAEHDGRPYTRYRIAESRANVGPDRVVGQFLPLFLEKCPGAEKSTAWYYRRLAKGNFTELEQKIPVHVLPPINGRFCKKIMISQYCCEYPWTEVSPEHYEQHMRDSFQAGFNAWISPSQKTADRVLKAGGRVILWNNYPFYGMKQAPSRPGYRWLNDHPEARARYFEDSDTWEKRDQYCPSYVVGEGRAAFLAEVKKSYEVLLSRLPGASIIYNDWEETPWISGDIYSSAREGKGSWCFCDRCKAEFRKWAHLPADADLSDANIFKSYKQQWDSFRVDLDAKVAGVAKEAANELGKLYMLYSWSDHVKLWAALRGNADLAFAGIPGSNGGDAGQKGMDNIMKLLRDKADLSREKVMGQEFASSYLEEYLGHLTPQAFLKGNRAHYQDRDPKLQKREIVRIVATLGLGVDLCSSMERSGGTLYWIGEATRILATYEDLFHEGERDDALASCDKLEYPNVLVLKRGDERVVLLFNETDKPLAVTLLNKDLKPGQIATVFGASDRIETPAEMKVTIPEGDVTVVHIQ